MTQANDLRDQIALQVMTLLWNGSELHGNTLSVVAQAELTQRCNTVAQIAYRQADAMLHARTATPEEPKSKATP